MPYLPIAAALTSPYLNDTFTVLRGTTTVGDDGVAVVNRNQVFENIHGPITPTSRNDLARLSDDQRQVKTISIVSAFGLQSATAPNGAPDWVVWNGDTYQVFVLESYERYGLGFTHAICGLVASNPNVS